PSSTAPGASVPWRLRHATGTDRRLLLRSLITVVGRGLSKFAIVIFLILATRFLSKAEYGVYSYVLVLANTFGILADPQISLVAGREVAAGRRGARAAYWDAFPVVLAAGTAAAVGLICFGLVDPGPGLTPTELVLAGSFVVFNRLVGLGTDMLRSLGRFGLEATIETTGTILLVAVASLVAARGLGVAAVLGVFLAHGILSALACQVALRREVGAPRRPTRTWRAMFRTGISLSLAASATAVATRAPLIVLGSSASALAVASYSAGLRFADALYLLALTAGQALLPSIAALAGVDRRRALRLTRGVAGAGFALGLVLAGATAPFGRAITSTVFGAQYGSAGPIMSVLMLAVPFMSVFWIAWFSLFAYGGERDVLAVAGTGAAASLALSVAVIPAAGTLAAAWIYVGVLALLGCGCWAALERRAGAAPRP
ncbi:MAG TPA: oligosaccharide flippase family protein, partial [Solirubrobacteraceae bacterium]|nr:oligosaccharide flippase family protein [Solirubrobacteraceae bacterium]